METLEPQKYLASLIAAINDGAKSAQGSMFLFLLVGLYLLATAFSASDEDLLLGKTVIISQIGTSLPVSFSFAIAPLVFVFLHLYSLVRYDMLATNVRQFRRELRETISLESDRERCRQLLTNGEFMQALTAPPGSGLYSWSWPWLFRSLVTVFPVAVLMLVQINALRYQSDLILWVQRTWLVLDLAALTWFFARNPLNGTGTERETLWRWARHFYALVLLPSGIIWLNLQWLNVVPADEDAGQVRYTPEELRGTPLDKQIALAFSQPLDLLLCPRLNWGCRYLRVDHRTLVDKVWDNKAMAELRSDDAERMKALTGIEGVVLRDRSLRFAVLDESRLYAADMIGTDLSGASLVATNLSAARLRATKLRGVDLEFAQLRSADLRGAQLQGADLRGAESHDAILVDAQLQGANLELSQLQGASLGGAHLQAANLKWAQLQGANLNGTQLQGVDLELAQLQGAYVHGAQLQGAKLNGAQLQGAILVDAQLQGANLKLAQLQGAKLNGTQLQGADLSMAGLWNIEVDENTKLGLADLREINFDPVSAEDVVSEPAFAIPERVKKWLRERLAKKDGAGTLPHQVNTTDGKILVTNLDDIAWRSLDRTTQLTAQPADIDPALADLLAETVAPVASQAAETVARRVFSSTWREQRPLISLLGCRLQAQAEAGRVTLNVDTIDRLRKATGPC